jgi:hypothetical protein
MICHYLPVLLAYRAGKRMLRNFHHVPSSTESLIAIGACHLSTTWNPVQVSR